MSTRRRLTVTEMKESAKCLNDFYFDDEVSESSMAHRTWEFGMDVGSDAGESQQAEVVKVSKTSASISWWSLDSKSDSSMVFCHVFHRPLRRKLPGDRLFRKTKLVLPDNDLDSVVVF